MDPLIGGELSGRALLKKQLSLFYQLTWCVNDFKILKISKSFSICLVLLVIEVFSFLSIFIGSLSHDRYEVHSL